MDSLWNKWPVYFKNVKIMEDKDQRTAPDYDG